MKRAIVLVLLGGLFVGGLGPTVSAQPTTFRAVLSGGDEVPARDTLARGVAIVRLDAEGTALGFRLVVANIENVFAAHIHCGVAGVSGPVGVTLFTGAPGGGRTDGVLATGSVTAPDPGNLCVWADLDDVVAALESGVAYVNVHTSDGVAPADTGPGDFPGGEIRGQIF
jgi:CHRD domain